MIEVNSIAMKIDTLPPSTNRIWRAVKGRVLRSREYRQWIDEAHVRLMIAAKGKHLPPKCLWTLDVTFDGLSYRSDMDNCIKPLLDLLVKSGVTPDDRYLCELRAARGDKAKLPATHIMAACANRR